MQSIQRNQINKPYMKKDEVKEEAVRVSGLYPKLHAAKQKNR